MSLASPEITSRRAARPALATVLALLLLLAPVGYLYAKLLAASARTGDVVASERAAVGVGRPLNSLLAALVEARTTAARKVAVDDSGIRAAINDINRLDRSITSMLDIDQRWQHLTSEIDRALSRNATGADALTAYETPIEMTIALLEWVTDSSQVTQDPAGSFVVIDVALHLLPEAIASAGGLAALAVTSDNRVPSQIRLAVERDHLEHLTEEIGHALRSTDRHGSQFASSLGVLRPLDEFSAATDEVANAATDPQVTGAALRERIEASSGKVRMAALALAAAVFNAFGARLDATAGDLAGERRLMVLAGAVMVVAALWLLWLRVPWRAWRAWRHRRAGEAGPDSPGRHGRQEQPPSRPDAVPQLVDARELLNREAADAGRTLGARKR